MLTLKPHTSKSHLLPYISLITPKQDLQKQLFFVFVYQEFSKMSNHPKVHPLHDPEARSARPSAPLVSGAYPRSEQGDPAKYPLAPPRKRGRSCCCRCVCCTLCLLFLLVVAVGATIGALYLVYKPKLPDYSIDRLQLTLFALNQDSSLSTAFNVTITAKNSNEKIGIYYEDGSEITVWYKEAKLSQGTCAFGLFQFNIFWFTLLKY